MKCIEHLSKFGRRTLEQSLKFTLSVHFSHIYELTTGGGEQQQLCILPSGRCGWFCSTAYDPCRANYGGNR